MTQQSTPANPPTAVATPPAPLRVSRVEVRNFRLLRKVDVDLSGSTTVLVGRNNSGKTTLAEAITCFLQASTLKLSPADFSAESYAEFRDAWLAYKLGNTEEARRLVPEVSLKVEISYRADLTEYGPLAIAIVDLDPDCTDAVLHFKYSLKGGRLNELFAGLSTEPETGDEPNVEAVLAVVGGRIPALFERTIIAVDPNDMSNTRDVSVEAARRLITVHFLKAQRGLNDEKDHPNDLIGKVLQTLFDAASKSDAGSAQRTTADELSDAVAQIEQDLGTKVGDMMAGITPALQQFGYPGLNDPGLQATTSLDIERLLSNFTSIRYRGAAGVSLPESYSGLGSRNLILMLLTLLGSYREYAARGSTPGLHLVFIEEPEAHLHPQMQEVFIEQLSTLANLFPKLDKSRHPWAPQFLVSTHSSHVANRAEFADVRYFRVDTPPLSREESHTEVLRLSDAPGLDSGFLHKYLTLTRSDLFFADKAILVEGTSERLIVPAAIRKTANKRGGQYVTLMEVGGAYAHVFFPLLDFLGIPALIITDIDTIGQVPGKEKPASTIVHDGQSTSNATIKHWFPDEKSHTPTALLAAAGTDAIIRGNRYLAYQVPEASQEACGRSFEDAFILANPEALNLTLRGEAAQDERLAQEVTAGLKKSDFALRFAVDETEWHTPRYIQQGLDWLLAQIEPEELGAQAQPGDEIAVR